MFKKWFYNAKCDSNLPLESSMDTTDGLSSSIRIKQPLFCLPCLLIIFLFIYNVISNIVLSPLLFFLFICILLSQVYTAAYTSHYNNCISSIYYLFTNCLFFFLCNCVCVSVNAFHSAPCALSGYNDFLFFLLSNYVFALADLPKPNMYSFRLPVSGEMSFQWRCIFFCFVLCLFQSLFALHYLFFFVG